MCKNQTPQPDFLKIRLAEQIFRLTFGLAEFVRKLQNSAENTAEQYKFGILADKPDIQNEALQHINMKFLTCY